MSDKHIIGAGGSYPRRPLKGAIVRRTRIVTVGERRAAPPRRERAGGVIGAHPEPARASFNPGAWFTPKVVAALSAVAILAIAAGGGWWVFRSSYFEIKTVSIEGTQRVNPDGLAQRAGLSGQSMFNADIGSAQDALALVPLVKEVHIQRHWPDSVTITIVERQGWGIWEQSGVRYVVDRDGVVLGEWEMPPGTPVIRSSALGSRRPGDRVDYQAVDAAAEIYANLPKQLGTRVTEVAFLPGKGVRVTTETGQVGLLGDSSSIPYKLASWAAVEQKAADRGIAYNTIDLRFGNRPVVQ
ncbi:MAG: FtsQ-type POTRA domain-containing protein [Dehalococcoidia bacterium]